MGAVVVVQTPPGAQAHTNARTSPTVTGPLSPPAHSDGGLNVPTDDTTLVVRAQEGDAWSFEVLVRRHQVAMYRLAWRLLGDTEAATDAVQDAFVAAWRRLPAFRGDAAFSSWMYRIVTNRCLSLLRARPRSPRAVELDPERSAPGATGPESAAIASAEQNALTAAVAALPENLRVCWVLRESEQMGYAEIAAIVGTSPDTVRGRIYRARQQLAKEMRAWR
jgi:RNA polymerase sigma-70 factor (ECF subfamily)